MSDSGRPVKLLAAVAWSSMILLAVAVPGRYVPGPMWNVDKLVHLVLFAVLAWLWLRALPGAWIAVSAAGSLYGILTEIGQAVLPGERTGDPLDAAADILGIALGLLAATWWNRRTAAPPQESSGSRGR